MKLLSLSLSVLSLVSLSSPFTPAARADALDKSRIPADARWLAHVDIDALKRSTLFAALKEGPNGIHMDDEELAEFKAMSGIDPFTDLKSVTIYCASPTPDRAVVLMTGNEKLDVALANGQKMAGYRTEQEGARQLHVWTDGDETWYGWLKKSEGSADRVAVLSKNKEDLLRGIGVLEGTAPSLRAERDPQVLGMPSSGSIVYAATAESLTELSGIETASKVAKLAQTMAFDLGEDRGSIFAHLTVDTRNAEDALKIQQVLQGAVALVGLMSEDPDVGSRLTKLVGALRFTSSGSRFNADFRYDVKLLLEDLAALEAADHDGEDGDQGDHEKHEKHEKHHGHDGHEKQ